MPATAIRAGDAKSLLTAASGDAVHLTHAAGPGETGRGRGPGSLSGRPEMAVGKAAIIKPRWAETTLSGRLWILMAGKAPKRVRRFGLDTHRALQAGHHRLARYSGVPGNAGPTIWRGDFITRRGRSQWR